MTAEPGVSVVIISKDEPGLVRTLEALEASREVEEVLVVDASEGRLDWIKRKFRWVSWIDFELPPGVKVSIPHQRNLGVRRAAGDVVAFIDCGCIPQPGWLDALVKPIKTREESVTSGISCAPSDVYVGAPADVEDGKYLREAPTITLAFRKDAYERVGGFDESFEYGSDVDFTWRLRDSGYRIRLVPDAVISTDWGNTRRLWKRARKYGAARVRLYAKHRHRRRQFLRRDPVPLVYAVFIMGLPVTLRFRLYPLLLLVPLWRARSHPRPLHIVAEHIGQGAGALGELVRLGRRL